MNCKIDSIIFKLSLLIVFTLIYALVELLVGQITNSSTLLADGYHMLADLASLIVALIGFILTSRPWSKSTFGWVRSEILGALINSFLLLVLVLEIVTHAIQYTRNPVKITDLKVILVVGTGGLIFNLIGFCVLYDWNPCKCIFYPFQRRHENVSSKQKMSKSTEMNLRGAALHLLGDLFASILVLVSTAVNLLIDREWTVYIDPILSLFPAFFISMQALRLLYESGMILLETIPSHIKVDSIKRSITNCSRVLSVHEFHLWRLSGDVTIASLHCVFATPNDYIASIKEIKHIFCQNGVHSTTIQPEFISSPFTMHDTTLSVDTYVKYCQAISKSCDGLTCCIPNDS